MFDAKETLNQLTQSSNGIGRLTAMIGATNFVKDDNSITFKFKMNPKIKYCRITLNSLDLYDMEFINCKGTVIEESKGLYNDMLKRTFEQTTKMYLSL